MSKDIVWNQISPCVSQLQYILTFNRTALDFIEQWLATMALHLSNMEYYQLRMSHCWVAILSHYCCLTFKRWFTNRNSFATAVPVHQQLHSYFNLDYTHRWTLAHKYQLQALNFADTHFVNHHKKLVMDKNWKHQCLAQGKKLLLTHESATVGCCLGKMARNHLNQN